MRYLALDVGDERIGEAISDETGSLARPLEIIARVAGPSSFRRLAALIAQHGVESVVVGLPLLSDGSEGKQARSTMAYLRGLERHVALPIVLWDERSSTQQAREIIAEAAGPRGPDAEGRFRGARKARRRADDAVAAAVILQDYLNARSEAHRAAAGQAQPGG